MVSRSDLNSNALPVQGGKLPPGPKGLPIVGNLFEPRGDALGYMARSLQEYGDIVFFRLLGVPMCLVNRPEYIESVLVTQPQNFGKSKDYRALHQRRSGRPDGKVHAAGGYCVSATLIHSVAYHAAAAESRASGRASADLLSVLIQARDEEGGMSDQQLNDEVMTLFLAGHETTANALSWTLYLLAQNPEVEQTLSDELAHALDPCEPTVADLPCLPYTEMVLKESMRLYPPVWVIGRRALAPFRLGEYALPVGTNVLVSQYLMHRDARFFPIR